MEYKLGSSEIDPHTYCPLTFNEVTKVIQWEKSSISSARKLDKYVGKINFNSYTSCHTEIQMTTNLN